MLQPDDHGGRPPAHLDSRLLPREPRHRPGLGAHPVERRQHVAHAARVRRPGPRLPAGNVLAREVGRLPGDSGGPLLVRGDNGALRQIGIASHATHGGGWFDWLVGDRCSSRSFDFYSDVSGGALKTWVESVTRVRDHRN